MEQIFICEDSQEGVFTGIYDAYALKCDHDSTYIQVGEMVISACLPNTGI